MSVTKPFFLGILTAFFALVLEMVLSILFQESPQAYFFIRFSPLLLLSVFIEESLKYLIIYKIFRPLEKKNQIIGSGLLVGLGFAATEIFLDLYGQIGIIKTSFVFLIGILFIHFITAGFSAYLISKKENAYFTTARALMFNTVLHFLYNMAIIYFF